MDKKQFLLKYIITLLVIFIVLSTSCTKQNVNPSPGKDVTGTLMHDGLSRAYLIHVPTIYETNAATPLVFALHGGGGTGKKMNRFSDFNRLSDQHGFIVVYPDAVEKHWNDGRGLTEYRAQRENIDDIGFISKLIEVIADDYTIDRKRVYVTGASNGAMMSFRLACELTDKITAIAPVIGAMGEIISEKCTPSRSIPVLIIGGTGDPLVPWNGGHVRFFRKKLGTVLSFPETVRFWTSHNGCSQDPELTWMPDNDPDDGTRIRKKEYSPCRDGVKVILYEVQGGGHTWPGGPQYLPEWVVGLISRDMDGTEVIWEFFEKFSR